jgi:hypothetical protein
MSEHENFYSLLTLEKTCPRRTVFQLKGVKGISQYFHTRKRYERNRIYRYLADRFQLDATKISFQEIDDHFLPRLEQEPIGEYIDNLEQLILSNNIELIEIGRPIIYSFGKGSTELYLDGLGKFHGKNALFKFNFTTRFNRDHALELVCVEHTLRDSNKNIESLIILLLGSGTYREILKEGEKTKNGKLSKRGLPPWEELKKEVDELLQNGYTLKQKMEQNPESYNLPKFGPCNTCPYHNIEVEFNNKKIICTG